MVSYDMVYGIQFDIIWEGIHMEWHGMAWCGMDDHIDMVWYNMIC